jgi:hypothetical protein
MLQIVRDFWDDGHQTGRATGIEGIRSALSERQTYLETIGGCTDGYCIIIKPTGAHTNGGCKCWSDKYKMQRFAYADNKFADEIRTLLPEIEVK